MTAALFGLASLLTLALNLRKAQGLGYTIGWWSQLVLFFGGIINAIPLIANHEFWAVLSLAVSATIGILQSYLLRRGGL